VQPASPEEPGTLVDAAVMAERRARRAELAEQTLQQRAAAAEHAVVSMEARLSAAEERMAAACAERDALAVAQAGLERALRAARQEGFAERMLRETIETEAAELREVVEVVAGEAEQLESELERTSRGALRAARAAEAERDAAEAELDLVRHHVARRLDAMHQTLAGLREELDDRVIAERGRAALALAREREHWETAVESERRRADAERGARRRAEAELGAHVIAGAPEPRAAPAPHGDELGRIKAIDMRGLSRPRAPEETVAVAETVIADLARAADRLRAQVEARTEAPAAEPTARRRRRRWWAWPWPRSAPAGDGND
jgi:hypothetical protein